MRYKDEDDENRNGCRATHSYIIVQFRFVSRRRKCPQPPENQPPYFLTRQKKSWVDSGSGSLPSE
jgi:hypothetical protein